MAIDYFKNKQYQGSDGGANPTPAQGGTVTAPQRSGGSGSGTFTNLSAYLDANKASDLGGQVAGKIQTEVDEARAAHGTAATDFRGRVTGGSVQQDAGILGRVGTDVQGLAGDEAGKESFLEMKNARYTGPGSFSGDTAYQPALKETTEAAGQLEATKSAEGRTSLLGTHFGRPSYSGGEKRLDRLLLDVDPNARSQFETLRQGGEGVTGELSALNTTLTGESQQAGIDTAATKAAAEQTISDLLGTTNQATTDRLASRQANLASERAGWDRAIATNNFDNVSYRGQGLGSGPALKANLGIDKDAHGIYGRNLGDYYSTIDPNLLNQESVRTEGERDTLNALNQLEAGFDFNAGAAGTYDDEHLSTFDRGRFEQAGGVQVSRMNDKLNQTIVKSMNATTNNTPLPAAIAKLEKYLAWARGNVDPSQYQWAENELPERIAQRDAIQGDFGHFSRYRT